MTKNRTGNTVTRISDLELALFGMCEITLARWFNPETRESNKMSDNPRMMTQGPALPKPLTNKQKRAIKRCTQ